MNIKRTVEKGGVPLDNRDVSLGVHVEEWSCRITVVHFGGHSEIARRGDVALGTSMDQEHAIWDPRFMLIQTSIFEDYLSAVTAEVRRLIDSREHVVAVVIESETRHARV
jgi:hypothetical protein